ncbi:MAG: prepilin-type N-terminal cleavage/methylation domain-containing protein [Gemmatimonadetes bacterium]|nr:prepilin-type N-terminal cleavage/methylation domain-containing protein [Gemmatimonadota bacterium]
MKSKKGFTIISLLIAVVLLTVGLMALGKNSADIIWMQSTAATRHIAASIARAYMEELRSRDPITLVSEAVTTVNEAGVPDASGNYQRTVVVEDFGTNLVQIRVTVNYPRARVPIFLLTLAFVNPN